MKRILLALSVFVSAAAVAQTQIPNSNFESVYTATGMNSNNIAISYDSLTGGWTSGNAIKRDIPIDDGTTEYQFMQDTTYTWNTSSIHALVLRTFDIAGVIATGNVGTGVYFSNGSNPFNSVLFGVPFADRPISMIGYYQYKSVAGDTCLIEVTLTKWNTVTSQRDTLAHGKILDNQTFTSFHQFSIPFTYGSVDVPDTCSIVCLSSAYAYVKDLSETPRGQVGSTLIIDDFKMIYDQSGIEEASELKGTIYASGNNLIVDLQEQPLDATIQLIDLSGKEIFKSSLKDMHNEISIKNKGVIIVRIQSSKGTIEQKLMFH